MASYFAGVMVRLMLTLTPVVCITAAMAISRLYATYLDPSAPSNIPPATLAQAVAEKELLADEAPAISSATAPTTPSKSAAKKRKASAQVSAVKSTPTFSTTEPPSSLTAAALGQSPRASRWAASPGVHGVDTRITVIGIFSIFLAMFCLHCTWVTSTAYSSPSVVLASRGPDGSQHIIDDFREAYYWLRENTPKESKVMSWWCVVLLRSDVRHGG